MAARSWERKAAPEATIQFKPSLRLVKKITARDWEGKAASEDLILLLLESN